MLDNLRKLTHQDLGPDPAAWKLWWDRNRESIEKAAGVVSPTEPGGRDEKREAPAAGEREEPWEKSAETGRASEKRPAGGAFSST